MGRRRTLGRWLALAMVGIGLFRRLYRRAVYEADRYDRRSHRDRRSGIERRSQEGFVAVERRSGADRRSGRGRRSRAERRAVSPLT